jgi:hypothetical protein
MDKKWLTLGFLILIVLFSGCSNQPDGFEYKDEALKMETELPDKTLPNQVVNMVVTLTNQVEYPVNNVNLRVTDFYKLVLLNQKCPYGNELRDLPVCGFISDKCGCHFENIQSLDDREINFVFRVPDEDELARIGRDLKPEITLNYSYFGENVFFVPILSLSERTTKSKVHSSQTKGPIHVEVERGLTQSGNSWEKEGVAFPIIVWVKDVINSDSKIVINNESFNMTLINLQTAGEGGVEAGRCDFNIIHDAENRTVLWPKGSIELPMTIPLICTLVGTLPAGIPWRYGMVVTSYDYTYTIVKTETLTVETAIV